MLVGRLSVVQDFRFRLGLVWGSGCGDVSFRDKAAQSHDFRDLCPWLI